MWHVTFTEGFKKDIERYPTTLINKLEHHLPFFRANPFQPNPAVKRLKNRTNTFRLRFGDFRLQYHVFTAGHQVVLGCLKPRQEIYRNSLPDKTPTGEDVDVLIPTITHQQPDAPEGASKEELTGLGILPEELFLIGIEKAHHKRILACHHLSDLENSQLPSPVSQRVLDYCTNPRPTHMGKLYSLDPNEHFANIGDKPLSAFLLWLDPQQQEIVNKDLNKGPLAVRGGPGTGKTLIGLHRLVQLIERRARETPNEIPVRFGFISYNKSLVQTTRELFQAVRPATPENFSCEFATMDQLAGEILHGSTNGRATQLPEVINDDANLEGILQMRILNPMMRSSDPDDARAASTIRTYYDRKFLRQEIVDVIEDNALASLEEYVQFQRRGRQTPLNQSRRRHFWRLYKAFRRYCLENNRYTWSGRRLLALRKIHHVNAYHGRFDALFVDEVQDLSVVALRLCVELVKDPRFLMLSADTGQSIYNRAPTWKNVHPALKLRRHNSFVLRKNYRMTQQLLAALAPLRREISDEDKPVGNGKAFFTGERPVWDVASAAEHPARAAAIAGDLVNKSNLNAGQIAIIVRNKRQISAYRDALNEQGITVDVFCKDRPVDLNSSGVHLITAHSAKGLEFPFVILPEVMDGIYPSAKALGDSLASGEIEENRAAEQRVFYVAASRACRRLWMLVDENQPSPFVKLLDASQWEHTPRVTL